MVDNLLIDRNKWFAQVSTFRFRGCCGFLAPM